MDLKTNAKRDVLEHMLLNPSAELAYLPLSLLEDITNGFAVDLEIGSGGFAVVYKVHCFSTARIIIVVD